MDWEQAYRNGHTPWDLWQITPPLRALLDAGQLAALGIPERARVAVPGCGRGHDLRAWHAAGYRVTGFDVAPQVVREARELLRLNRVAGVEVLCRDLFGLGHEFAGAFDLVFDYTCFAAIPPHLRAAYGREMARVLAGDGHWLGLAFPMSDEFAGRARPPHRIVAEDLDAALGLGLVRVADFAAVGSVPERAGAERWFLWRKR